MCFFFSLHSIHTTHRQKGVQGLPTEGGDGDAVLQGAPAHGGGGVRAAGHVHRVSQSHPSVRGGGTGVRADRRGGSTAAPAGQVGDDSCAPLWVAVGANGVHVCAYARARAGRACRHSRSIGSTQTRPARSRRTRTTRSTWTSAARWCATSRPACRTLTPRVRGAAAGVQSRCADVAAPVVSCDAGARCLDQDQERGRHDSDLPPLVPRGNLWLLRDEHGRCAAPHACGLAAAASAAPPAPLPPTRSRCMADCRAHTGTNGLACLTRISEGAPMKIYPLPRKPMPRTRSVL